MDLRARRLAVASLLGGFALVVSTANVIADDKKKDDKVPDLHAIMEKNKEKLAVKVQDAAKAEKWDDAQKKAKELKELGEALGKNKPHKGSDESWAKFAKTYAENTKAVYDAAEKKDAKAVETAVGTFTKSCGACHKVHK